MALRHPWKRMRSPFSQLTLALSPDELRLRAVTFGCKKNESGVSSAGDATRKLFSDTEPIDDLVVAIDVAPLEVIKQTSPLVHHLEQAATRMIILNVGFEVLGQIKDALS